MRSPLTSSEGNGAVCFYILMMQKSQKVAVGWCFFFKVASLRDAFRDRAVCHHTALRLYGVNCTACVLPLRGCGRDGVHTVSTTSPLISSSHVTPPTSYVTRHTSYITNRRQNYNLPPKYLFLHHRNMFPLRVKYDEVAKSEIIHCCLSVG